MRCWTLDFGTGRGTDFLPSGGQATDVWPPSSLQIAKKAPHNESATVGRSASYKRSGKW